MRKTIVSITAAFVTLVLATSAQATTPGSNIHAFENCDVAVCINRDGDLDYNLYGEDTRLFESLSISNLHRGTITKAEEFGTVTGLQLKVDYYCVTKREGSRLPMFNAAQAVDWAKLNATVKKCGYRAGK